MKCCSAWLCVVVAIAVSAIATAQSDSSLERELEHLNTKIGDAPSRYHHDRAEVLFRLGRFDEAVRDYDRAVEFGEPHDDDSCWERGLAQYYAGDFKAAAEQFERYHHVGPMDIENGLWRFLCIAETDGLAKAREAMLDYPRRVRPPFPALLDLYLGKGDGDAVLQEATDARTDREDLQRRLFNSHYYVGKYHEVLGGRERALEEIRAALVFEIPHFMYACAQIDAARLEADSNTTSQEE